MKTLVAIEGWDFFRELVRSMVIYAEAGRKETLREQKEERDEFIREGVEVFGFEEEISERERVIALVTGLLGERISEDAAGSPSRNNPKNASSTTRLLGWRRQPVPQDANRFHRQRHFWRGTEGRLLNQEVSDAGWRDCD